MDSHEVDECIAHLERAAASADKLVNNLEQFNTQDLQDLLACLHSIHVKVSQSSIQ